MDLPTAGPEDQGLSHGPSQSEYALSDCPMACWTSGVPDLRPFLICLLPVSQMVPSLHIGLTTSMTLAEKSPSLGQSTSPTQAT